MRPTSRRRRFRFARGLLTISLAIWIPSARHAVAGGASQEDVEAFKEYLNDRILDRKPPSERSWESEWGDSNQGGENVEPAAAYEDPREQNRLRELFQYEASIQVDASGRNALGDLSRAMISLIEQDELLATRTVRAKSDSTPCGLITKAIGPPGGCFWSRFMSELNHRNFRENPLVLGEELLVPEANVERRRFSRIIDPEWALEELGPSVEEFARDLPEVEVRELDNETVRVSWTGYRLRIVIMGEGSVARAETILRKLDPNLRWAMQHAFRERTKDESDPSSGEKHQLQYQPRFYSTPHNLLTGPLQDPATHLELCRNHEASTEPVVSDPQRLEGAYVRIVDPTFSGICNEHGLLDENERGQLGYGPGLSLENVSLPADREARAKVVMIDSGVCAHRDFGPNVEGAMSCGAPSAWNGRCDIASQEEWREAEHHGTHLAGLIVSQRNGQGFVGLNPDARIVSYRLTEDEGALMDQLDEWLNDDDFWNVGGLSSRRLPIFVFASQLVDQVPPVNSRGLVEQPEHRFATRIAEIIESQEFLLIVAAGQDEDGEQEGVHIGVESPMAPQNLGDLRNVLVVTGCSPNCKRSKAKLDPQTHYSLADRESLLHLVHVAAPSMRIPSAIESGRYIARGGSSQAAAFAAGVASSMVGCFPKYYNRANRVKQRLQLTSHPSLSIEHSKMIAAGVVDPFVATLHPKKDWVQISDEEEKWDGSKFKAAKFNSWCVDEIQFVDPTDATIEPTDFDLRTKDILRIVRYRVENKDSPDQWMVYLKNSDRRTQNGRKPLNRTGDILRVGPVGIGAGDASVIVAGSRLSLNDVEDLILAETVALHQHEECVQ